MTPPDYVPTLRPAAAQLVQMSVRPPARVKV